MKVGIGGQVVVILIVDLSFQFAATVELFHFVIQVQSFLFTPVVNLTFQFSYYSTPIH